MTRPNSSVHLVTCAIIACALGAPALASAQSLIPDGAEARLLRGGFSFIEGPAADAQGNIYFTDIPENLIYQWSVDGELSVVRKDSGGANGLAFDKDANLLACEGSAQRITSMSPDGTLTVIAERYNGKRLNSPNDLWIDAKDGFYFTDPRYQGGDDPVPQGGEHVYYVSPDRATVTRVVDSLKKPNGIMGSLDGKTLYVADTTGRTFAFDINDDASVTNERIFANQGSDGVTLDERGNLYLTWMAGVTVYSPSGEKLEVIKLPEMPANCGFGGGDGKTLFITARTGLYAIKMNVRGRPAANRP